MRKSLKDIHISVGVRFLEPAPDPLFSHLYTFPLAATFANTNPSSKHLLIAYPTIVRYRASPGNKLMRRHSSWPWGSWQSNEGYR